MVDAGRDFVFTEYEIRNSEQNTVSGLAPGVSDLFSEFMDFVRSVYRRLFVCTLFCRSL